MAITVGQLINRLKEYPDDTRVVFQKDLSDDFFEIDNRYPLCVDNDTVGFKADGTVAAEDDEEIVACDDAVIITGYTYFDNRG